MTIIEGRDEKKQEEFNKRIMPYLNDIYSTARRMARNDETAENITAKVFKEAWDCFDPIRPETDARIWLYCIFAGICLAGDWSLIRLGPAAPPNSGELEDESLIYHKLSARGIHQGDDAVTNILANLTENEIYEALDQLPGSIRFMVVLHDFQSLAMTEIGQVLGIPVGSIRLWLRRGRYLFQRALWSQLADSDGVRNSRPNDLNPKIIDGISFFVPPHEEQRRYAGPARKGRMQVEPVIGSPGCSLKYRVDSDN